MLLICVIIKFDDGVSSLNVDYNYSTNAVSCTGDWYLQDKSLHNVSLTYSEGTDFN